MPEKKFKTNIEIQAELAANAKSLEQFVINANKALSVFDDMSKRTKSSTGAAGDLVNVLNKIPELLKDTESLSKRGIFSNKISQKIISVNAELNKLQNSIFALGESKDVTKFDEKFKKLADGVQDVTNKISGVYKEIEKVGVFEKILGESIQLLSVMDKKQEEMKASSMSISQQYAKQTNKLKENIKLLEAAKKGDNITLKILEEQNKNLSDTKKNVNKIFEDAKDSSKELDKILDSVNMSVRDSARYMQNVSSSTDSISFANLNKELNELQKKVQTLKDQGRYTKEEFQDIAKEYSRLSIKSKLVHEWEEINSKEKISHETLLKVKGIINDIKDEEQNIVNVGLKEEFTKQYEVAQKIAKTIVEMISSGQASSDEIKTQLGLLKKQKSTLVNISKIDEKLEQIQENSTAGMIKRAKKEYNINKAVLKNMKNQKKSFGGLVRYSSLYVKNLKPAAVANFGKAGIVAAKATQGAMMGMMAMSAPLMMFAGIYAFIQGMLEIDKKTKAARKQLLFMAADTHTVEGAFDDLRHGALLSDTMIEKMRAGTEQWSWSLGISMDQANGYLQDFVSQGFKLTSAFGALEDLMGTAAFLGMEVSELAKNAGVLRSEYMMSLTDISSAFVQMQKDAKNASVSTSIFFDKVINTSIGLSLYGQKIEDISKDMSNLIKNMKLPEGIATKAAGDIAKSFFDLSTEMQITTYRLGKGQKLWREFYSEQLGSLNKYNKKSEQSAKKRISEYDKQIDAQSKAYKNAKTDNERAEVASKITALMDAKHAKQKEAESLKEGARSGGVIDEQISAIDERIKAQEKLLSITKEGVDAELIKQKIKDLGVQKDQKNREKLDLTKRNKMGGPGGEAVRSTSLDASRLFKMRLDAVGDKFGVHLEDNIENIDNAMKKSFFEMEKLGETFGLSKEGMRAIQALTTTLSTNYSSIKETFGPKQSKGVLDILNSVSAPDEKQGQLNEVFKGIQNKSNKGLLDIVNELHDRFPDLASEFSSTIDDTTKAADGTNKVSTEKLAKILSIISTSLDSSSKQVDKIQQDDQAQQAKIVGLEMLSQTKSVEDALRNTLEKWIRNIYLALETLIGLITKVFGKDLGVYGELSDNIKKLKLETSNKVVDLTGQQKSIEHAIASESAKSAPDQGTIQKLTKKLETVKTAIVAYTKVSAEADESNRFINKTNVKDLTPVVAKKIIEGLQTSMNAASESESALKPRKSGDVNVNTPLQAPIESKTSSTIEVVDEFAKAQQKAKLGIASLNDLIKIKNFKKIEKKAEGGIVGGGKFSGDQIITALNSGEAVLNRKQLGDLQEMINNKSIDIKIPQIDKVSSLLDSIKTDKANQSETNKVINDNRIINISVNQNDKNAVEQIVLKAIYTDKML